MTVEPTPQTERDDPSGRSHRVVIVGGGFGGLPAARLLGGRPVEVTLIDRRNHHLFQPLLYQTATGMIAGGQIAPALRHVLRHESNVRVQLAEVVGFDLERRIVRTTAAGRMAAEYPYDTLIVAAGVTQSYFGHDEFAFFAPGMKTLDDALELRRRIFGAFEVAEMTDDPKEQGRWLTVVVVGAGPTGVELAGQVRELATRSLRGEFRTFDASSVRVVLVDGGDEPLPTFGDQLSGKATEALERLGVELRMGARVVGVDADGVDIEGAEGPGRIEARTTIWAAGVEASPLARLLADASGATVDRAGRIAVLPDLTLPGHPEVFAVGDMVTLDDLPGVAEVAMQGGLHAANTVLRRLKGHETKTFRYRDLGSVATIGRFRAIVSVKGIHLSGFPGWVVWMFVHLAFLTGFGNRLITMLRWLRSMIGRGRAEREFSTAHTGGDLSLPDQVKREVEPTLFPVVERSARTGPSYGHAATAEPDDPGRPVPAPDKPS
ncbi:MAG TPA: NAD(P)/FAD-dependent oxidoreductase [Acidimicrobiales bacterium]|nr:NAD(P)/FAD-dependent oxidoreductase [Acidimicrobiales bacterium]